MLPAPLPVAFPPRTVAAALLFLVGGLQAAPAVAQDPGAPPASASMDRSPADSTAVPVLGINLEGVAYPYPVHRFAFESQNRSLEMAYMDVRPEDPNGQTVMLLHGKNFNGDYWGRTAGDLAAAGFRVVIPDQIGFGKSTKPPAYQFSFHQLARNTARLLDSIGVERTAVVGHSMGGMLATRFALMYPERTERLALVNPIGLEDWKRKGVPYRGIAAWYERELARDYEGIKAYQRESYYDGAWEEAYERPVKLLAGMTKSPDWPRMAQVQARTYDMIYTQPVVYEFDRLDMPTLLIIGTRDRTALGKDLVSAEVRQSLGRYGQLARETAEAIPNATLVTLEDTGHLPHFEAYDRYIDPLVDFLR